LETKSTQKAVNRTLKTLLVATRDSWERIFWAMFSVKAVTAIIAAGLENEEGKMFEAASRKISVRRGMGRRYTR
jgi:hypothetical protein